MRDTIKEICKQVHRLLPDVRIAITRFTSKYEYGQIYIGELDRSVKRGLMGYTMVVRNFCLVYSEDPTRDQELARQDFEKVCTTLQDFALHTDPPLWHATNYDVFEHSLVLDFQIWERYLFIKGEPTPIMGSLDTTDPIIVYDGNDLPNP